MSKVSFSANPNPHSDAEVKVTFYIQVFKEIYRLNVDIYYMGMLLYIC